MVNSPLIRPYFWGGGGTGGVPLDSHEHDCILTKLGRHSKLLIYNYNGKVSLDISPKRFKKLAFLKGLLFCPNSSLHVQCEIWLFG